MLICRTKLVIQSDQGTWWDAGLTDLGPQTRGFASSVAWSAHAQAEDLSHSLTHCEAWSLLTRKAVWENLGVA